MTDGWIQPVRPLVVRWGDTPTSRGEEKVLMIRIRYDAIEVITFSGCKRTIGAAGGSWLEDEQ